MPSITNCHLFRIKRKLGQENVFEFDVREDYGVLKGSPTFWNPQIGCGQEDSNPRFGCTPLVPEGGYGPYCQIFFLSISAVHLCQVQTAAPGGNTMPDAWLQNMRKASWWGRGGNPTGPGAVRKMAPGHLPTGQALEFTCQRGAHSPSRHPSP